MVNPKIFLGLVALAVLLFVLAITSISNPDAQLMAESPQDPAAAAQNPAPQRDGRQNAQPEGAPPSGGAPNQRTAPGPAQGAGTNQLPRGRQQPGQQGPAAQQPPAGGQPLPDGQPLADGPAADIGGHLPLMIRWSNWRPEFGTAYVYARERDLSGMLSMDAPVKKMLMTTSYAEFERLMARSEELKAAGVTTVGLNTENGMTPADEMQTLNDPDPQRNIVARVARVARENGFEMMWGPIRNMTDQVSDETIATMMEAGVTGLAMQEQKFIENQPPDARLQAVNATRDRYLAVAQRLGIENFTFHVQIMRERCPSMPNCVAFVEGLEQIPVDSIAIWSNGPIPVDFVSSIRGDGGQLSDRAG